MPVVYVSPKSVTFTYGALDASAQVTTVEVGRSGSTTTLQTLADSLITSSEKTVTFTVGLIFDPSTSGISNLLHQAWVDGTPGALEVDYGGAVSSSAAVTVGELGEAVDAAAGQVTQTATLTSGSPDVITWLTAP